MFLTKSHSLSPKKVRHCMLFILLLKKNSATLNGKELTNKLSGFVQDGGSFKIIYYNPYLLREFDLAWNSKHIGIC